MASLIYLDPGHGGSDPGASHFGTNESDLNLAIAHRVYAKLTAAGLLVGMTRSEDRDVGLAKRYNLANDNHADLYISIHCNAFGDPSAHGTETLIRNNATKADIDLALMMQRHMVAALGLRDRGVKQQELGMLRGAQMPCCLVEPAFMSNPDEHRLLCSEDGQERAAEAICAAVLEWLGMVPVVPGVRVMVDGQFVDMQAEIREDDRVWVRLRDMELLGYSVEWAGEQRIVKLDRGL